MKLPDLFTVGRPIIGGIPLLPLPGSPRYEGKFDRIVEIALEDAAALEAGRVNVLSEAFVTDQGIVEGAAADLMRARRLTGAEQVAVFADVHVKHALSLLPRPIRESALDLVERALADVLIVSGPRTGHPPSAKDLAAVRGVADVLIGSGLTPDNAGALLARADGAIVGTWFRQDSDLRNRVDRDRVRAFMDAVRGIRGR